MEDMTDPNAVVVTDHADERIKERLGLPKSARQTAAQRAFDKGKTRDECVGKLKRYLDLKCITHRAGNNIRIYAEHIWVFQDNTLITVYDIQKRMKSGVK